MTRFTRRLALTLIVGGAAVASAQRPLTRPSPPVSAPAVGPWANKFFMPGIDKEPTQQPPLVIAHDFGTVPYGTLCTQKFTITNIYDVPIQVTDIRVECGCLKAYPPNKVLQANEQAEFTVAMNAGMFKGNNAKKMYVTFGPNFVSEAVLRLAANSREDVSLTPGEIDFGIVSQGTKTSKTVSLKYNGRQRDWKLTEVVSSNAAYEVEVKEATRGPLLGVEYYVTVTLKSDAVAGNLNDAIAIKTNDPAVPLVNVNVRAVVLAPVRVSPDKLEFKNIKLGEAATYKVMLDTAATCLVTPQAEDADGFSVETSSVASQKQMVRVKFEPKKAGTIRKDLKLQTNLPGNPSVTIVVEGGAK